jgi:multidrug efflux pump subunit AcrA (membrane-fusion protein)
MAFTEDLNTYFADFTDTVVHSSTTYKGILDQPDEMIADGLVVTTDYQLTAKTSDLGALVFDATVTVNSVDYKVRNVKKIDDGTLCIVFLMKV